MVATSALLAQGEFIHLHQCMSNDQLNESSQHHMLGTDAECSVWSVSWSHSDCLAGVAMTSYVDVADLCTVFWKHDMHLWFLLLCSSAAGPCW